MRRPRPARRRRAATTRRSCSADGLKGARIGIPRAFYYDAVQIAGREAPRGGLNAEQAKVMADAIAVLKQQGAVVVDPADVPSFVDKDPKNNFLLWDFCSGADHAKGKDANCSVNFKYGMKRDFNRVAEEPRRRRRRSRR